MPSHPTLFDDEGQPRPRDDSGASPGGTATGTAHEAPAEPTRPNYLFRRALVIGGIVAVIAAAAVIVGSLLDSGGDDTSSGAANPEWNRVVLIDDRTGRITLTDGAGDDDGDGDDRINTVASPTASEVVGATAVVTSEQTTAIVDLADQTRREIELPATQIVVPSGSTRTVIAPAATGQRGLLVHGTSGEVIDTDEFAPVAGATYEFATARTDTSGRHVLVTDSGNFQSVLFSFDRDEPSFFPGLALAVGDDIVVTAQNVGNDATVSVFDHAGDPRTSGRTASVRAGLIAGDTVRLVTVDGDVVTMSIDSGDTQSGSTVDIGTVQSGAVMATGDRLVLTGSSGTAIIDDTGAVVGTYPDALPLDDVGSLRGADCIVLAGDGTTAPSLAVVNARTGSIVVESDLVADDVDRTADGCTVAVPRAGGIDILTDGATDTIETVEDATLLAIAPDGALLAIERDRRVELVPLALEAEVDDSEPIDLGTTGRRVVFTQT